MSAIISVFPPSSGHPNLYLKGNDIMKITNIEKFRKELFNNLRATHPADFTELSETRFERSAENGNLDKACVLWNCVEVNRYGHERPFYIELDEEGHASIWTINKGEKFFTYITTVYDWDYSKTQYMMRVAVELCRCLDAHKD
jgi:hypothetical protein